MDQYSKRKIIFIIAGVLLAGVLTTWLTIIGVQRYLASIHADDPLAKAGGLSDMQKNQKSGPVQ